LAEGGLFDKKIDSPDIPTINFMMRARERNRWRRIVHLPK
jgi:hypothetical protein